MLHVQGFRTRLEPVLTAVREAARIGALLRLGTIPGAPLMPSLNGWLLGYPVVYLVDAANVDAAARCLSDAPLLLVEARAPGGPEVRPVQPKQSSRSVPGGACVGTLWLAA